MRIALALTIALAACAPDRPDFPLVQASSEASPSRIVSFNRTVSGTFRAISPRCDVTRVGRTVEFRNYSPDLPLLVNGTDGPEILWSPSVMAPYNFVAGAEGEASYSYWRFTFTKPGVYDFYDAASGEPGRKIVDKYYGTVSYVGTAGNATRGTICVGDAAACAGVCCTSSADCPSGQVCSDGPNGRCLTP